VQYLLLIYDDDMGDADMESPDMRAVLAAYEDFNRELEERGVNMGANALQPISTATTVRVRDGETLITDGPFAETKEILGGYYLVEAADLDEALEIAAKIPGAQSGAIEVRPILHLE